ncbi:MAG TPA: dCMP deaminase family protein [Candidatus Paceibacterota bacterium]|jgi:dCMP deaminase|nr:dCMP deaminase family protein [Candidatus Paceibacterota bacterium]HOX90844.1 dCMP deaminase family protein [Candidatus Paceibacterota bacterium]HPC12444.1 dCMP deaminase family protein [Candidatus Paceibacterota bacterium]HPI66767.1 dCMP deaminase family protein [Candidatus Paceibacterota bacterium]HQC45995.1 dCMP deaminase family protein [Candidatus Paceibacterota bacterium]
MNKKMKKVEPRSNRISWDECFMRMAHLIAERSPDPSTQAGAIIANQNNVVVGVGYNGMPRGVAFEDVPWEREGDFEDTKYPYICHAEENAVYNANGSTKDCKLYCTLFPCNECAKTIIQNGIKEVIYDSDKYAKDSKFKTSKKLLKLAKIKLRQYSPKENGK